ncbi:MAG: hypothetical protein ABI426_10925 [Flavobacterium sp.]
MKTLAFIFLSLFMTKSCHKDKDKAETAEATAVKTEEVNTTVKENVLQETDKVEYEAMSRGFFKKIIFENNQIIVVSDRNNAEKGKVIMLSKEDISEFAKLLKEVNLEGLQSLKAPTDKRLYDGAAHANLTITSKGKIYVGPGFDHEFPPAAIEKLVKKLLSFSEDK